MSSVLGPGKTAVVTGASSGIGRAAALYFAAKGMNVWLVDVDEEELEAATQLTRSKCSNEQQQQQQQTIEGRLVDVSDEAAMMALADEVFARSGGKCHFLFNNAGIQLSVPSEGGILANNHAMKSTLDVNLYGPIHGCLAFVPRMKESGEEAIVVNTGSKQGITMPPGNLPYNVSKAALKCYTEGLQHDLRNSSKDCKVRAALLVPGWVNTSIVLKNERMEALARDANAGFDPDSVFFHEEKPADGAWMPQQVIEFMVEELDKGRFYLICPDNDVDRETDNIRMTWTMQDITQDRPPLSRWHPEYKDKFADYLKENKKRAAESGS